MNCRVDEIQFTVIGSVIFMLITQLNILMMFENNDYLCISFQNKLSSDFKKMTNEALKKRMHQ